MKEGLIVLMIVIGVVIGVVLLVEFVSAKEDARCEQLYGKGWVASGSYTTYCTSPTGEIKGYR